MLTKDWIRERTDEEISDAKTYFEAAQQCTEACMVEIFLSMGRQELEHAGNLFAMLAKL